MTNVTKLKIGGTEYSIDYNSLVNKPSSTAYTDLSNLTGTGEAVIDGQWVWNNYDVGSDISLTGTTDLEYDLGAYLPDDSYKYEVWFNFYMESTSYLPVQMRSTSSTWIWVFQMDVKSGTSGMLTNTRIIVDADKKIFLKRNTSAVGKINLSCCGYRRIGTNS